MKDDFPLLRGRAALVTGAGGGIGRGIAQALADAGASVVVAARRGATGDETVAMIEADGGTAFAIQTDVTVLAEVEEAVAAAVKRFDRLDIVVHNATHGLSGVPANLQEITDDAWDQQLAVDLAGAHHCARAAFQHLKHGHGRMVLLCSAFGLHGAGMNPVYAAIKGGIRGFTKALAREWGAHGITVNAISPAAATEATEAFFAQNPALRDKYLANFPMGRLGNSRTDIGGAVAAICSDRFGFVNGQVIQVDGGLYTAV